MVALTTFEPNTLDIHVGDTVQWEFHWSHTVSLGRDRVEFLDPATNELNPAASSPAGGDTFDGSSVVQSGYLPGQS